MSPTPAKLQEQKTEPSAGRLETAQEGHRKGTHSLTYDLLQASDSNWKPDFVTCLFFCLFSFILFFTNAQGYLGAGRFHNSF